MADIQKKIKKYIHHKVIIREHYYYFLTVIIKDILLNLK